MRVLSVSTIFPSADNPGPGVFIKERLLGLPADVHKEVLRLRPWFPGLSALKPRIGNRYSKFEDALGLPVHDREFFYIPGFMKGMDGSFLARRLRQFINSQTQKPDLIDAHFAFPTGFGACEVGESLGIPVCITLRGTLASYADDTRRPKLITALSKADKIISVSQSLADLAEDLVGKSLDIRVIGNGIDTKAFAPQDKAESRAQLGIERAAPMLLTVGGLVPRKGVQRVLDVLPSILKSHPDLIYVVVGGASVEGNFEHTLRAKIAELNLEDSVRLEGAVDHHMLPGYYSAADVFCLSTANEGWANALQESLACGTPVVTTDVGGNSEVVGDDLHGLVVPFDDPKALEHAILTSLQKEWQSGEIAKWGRRRSWQDVGKEVADVFRETQ
ncbi:MAG: teichuronic acid biosynthesis glycosyltransferase TuaC [Planctomycetota bacterium]|jgi:teichuronic acid biosynthesis glycosyltransferase TuaC